MGGKAGGRRRGKVSQVWTRYEKFHNSEIQIYGKFESEGGRVGTSLALPKRAGFNKCFTFAAAGAAGAAERRKTEEKRRRGPGEGATGAASDVMTSDSEGGP